MVAYQELINKEKLVAYQKKRKLVAYQELINKKKRNWLRTRRRETGCVPGVD